MQRKKNIGLLISLIAMIGMIIWLSMAASETDRSSVDKNIFRIENLEKVDRIVIESPKSKTDLRFDGSHWIINDGYQADEQMITILRVMLEQTTVKRAVASKLADSVKKEIAEHGVNVRCYQNGNLVQQLRVGSNSQKTETYFSGNDQKPYLVTIPGYRVFIAAIFDLPPLDWRNKRVFNFNWQNIKSLDVAFPADKKNNFTASFKEKIFSIDGIATDTTKLDGFMDALFQLRAERFVDSVEQAKYTNQLNQKPLIAITIRTISNHVYPLSVFLIDRQSNYFLGKINNDVVLLNSSSVKAIVRNKQYFIQAEQ